MTYPPSGERHWCHRCLINPTPRTCVTSTEGEALKYRPEYDSKVIGENLRRLREEKSLTVDEVREYLRLGSVQAVYKYEKGKSYPTADTMFALMELYEANLSDITCKHEDCACKRSEEGHKPSYTIYGYYISKLDAEIEIVNLAKDREQQAQRIRKYIEKIYKDIFGRGIAG